MKADASSRNPLPKHGRFSLGGVLAATLGLGLFIYFVNRVGISEILGSVRNVGIGFLVVITLSGLRFVVRTSAWMYCVKGTPRLRFLNAFQATLAGDALGNLTPLHLLLSEPAKTIHISNHASIVRTLPALAIENIFYTLSVSLVITCGLITSFLHFQTLTSWWFAGVGLLVALLASIGTVHWIILNQVRLASGTIEWFHRHHLFSRFVDQLLEHVRDFEISAFDLYPKNRSKLFKLALLEASFHLLALLEVYVVLTLISDAPLTLIDVFLFESMNRFINVVFKFVPLRLGVDEAGTGMLASILAFDVTTGVTLAIVRKSRMVFWAAIGIMFLVTRGLSAQTILNDGKKSTS